LDKLSAQGRKMLREILRDVILGSDGVSKIEETPRINGSHGDGFIPFGQYFFRMLVH